MVKILVFKTKYMGSIPFLFVTLYYIIIFIYKKNINYRLFFYKNEYLIFLYKYFLIKKKFTKKKNNILFFLWKVLFKFFFYLRNFCLITSRYKGVLKKFRLSRIKIRELGLSSLIFGFKKSYW